MATSQEPGELKLLLDNVLKEWCANLDTDDGVDDKDDGQLTITTNSLISLQSFLGKHTKHKFLIKLLAAIGSVGELSKQLLKEIDSLESPGKLCAFVKEKLDKWVDNPAKSLGGVVPQHLDVQREAEQLRPIQRREYNHKLLLMFQICAKLWFIQQLKALGIDGITEWADSESLGEKLFSYGFKERVETRMGFKSYEHRFQLITEMDCTDVLEQLVDHTSQHVGNNLTRFFSLRGNTYKLTKFEMNSEIWRIISKHSVLHNIVSQSLAPPTSSSGVHKAEKMTKYAIHVHIPCKRLLRVENEQSYVLRECQARGSYTPIQVPEKQPDGHSTFGFEVLIPWLKRELEPRSKTCSRLFFSIVTEGRARLIEDENGQHMAIIDLLRVIKEAIGDASLVAYIECCLNLPLHPVTKLYDPQTEHFERVFADRKYDKFLHQNPEIREIQLYARQRPLNEAIWEQLSNIVMVMATFEPFKYIKFSECKSSIATFVDNLVRDDGKDISADDAVEQAAENTAEDLLYDHLKLIEEHPESIESISGSDVELSSTVPLLSVFYGSRRK